MINDKLVKVVLFIAVLLSGLYAGTGFFIVIGGNPAIKLMSDSTFAEYWQHTDFYMAARMKIFGPLLLFTQLVTVIILIKKYRTLSFWFMIVALCILVVDIFFTLSTNHPLNRLIQSWDLNSLPGNVQNVKWQVAKAFDVRAILMISSFFMVLLSVWFHKVRQQY
jgi:hypothetical protein